MPLLRHGAIVEHVAVVPAAGIVVSARWGGELVAGDVATGRGLRRFQAHNARGRGLAVTPQGRWALSSGDDARVRLWSIESGESLLEYEGPRRSISALALSTNGRLVAA